MLPLIKLVKLLAPKVKSEGTCKQGERSDLTGCTPANGEAGSPDKKPDDTSAEKPSSKSTLSKEVAAKVHSPEFKAWFGDWEKDPQNASKVINPETGEPKETHVIPRAVYHGRSRKFDAFKEGESPGVVGFFSESESYAAEYGEVVEPFFLNIRKPLDLSQMGNAEDRYSQTGKSVKRKVKDWFKIMQEQGVDTSKINLGDEIDEDDRVPYWGLLDSSAGNVSKSSNLIAELRRQGFDGIIGREGEDNALAYAAFAPTQIKGADNEGSFDPSNPSTRKSLSSVLVDCPGCGGNVLSFGDLLFCREPGCEWQSPTEVYVKSLNAETKALHKFASTQFNLEGTIADTILEMVARIPDEDLAKDGRETEPHLTIKYGLHTDYPDEVKLALVEWMKLRGKNCVNVRLKGTSLFAGDGFEVVKIDVESDDLHSLNEYISSFLECTDTHPEYVPHVTLAYVKSGSGEKYVDMYDVLGEDVVLRHFVFSDADGKRTMFDMATYSIDRSLFGAKGICQQGERSDLTGCTPASGEASQQANQESSNTPADLLSELGDLYEQPEVKSRLGRMTKIAKGVLANVIATIGDLAPDVIPNAYDHARNALLSTAVPGIPVNDIALALSKVVAWTWKKVKTNANKALSVDKLEAIRDVTRILYAMLGLPDDMPLPTDEQIKESLKMKENKTKDMSAYDTTRGGALVGAPLKRRKLLHPSIKSFIAYRRKEVGGGTCQQGERSDLTGCTPASEKPSSKKPTAAKPTGGSNKKPSRRAVVSGESVSAKLEGEGKNQRVVMSDGTPAPKHITPAMIGKDWQDVKIYIDPNSDIRATGKRLNPKTGKVETKTTYRPEFAERNATIKWSRTIEGMKKYKAIQAEIQKDRKNPETKENADCSWLMQVQATRPGGEADTKGLEKLYGKKLNANNVRIIPAEGKKKATAEINIDGTKVILRDEGAVEQIAERLQTGGELFDSTYWLKSHGATTLEGRHVIIGDNGEVSLQFMGKESVWHNHVIRDPDLATMLIERKKKSGDAGKLFDTDYGKLSRYASKLDGGKFTAKDFRTTRANLLAVEAINSIPAPTDEKSYKAAVNEVGDRVSSVLGNDRAMALSSYIMPANFSAWRANIEQSE